jgi:prepilin-type N-terminal cleavage/methylation domain-containing protein/prepilin-type processing-associated H-X9-DG protein
MLNREFRGASKLLNRGEMVCRRKHSGFSLVELLIGMFIALVLYAMVVGPSREYVRKQKLQRCAENLRKLHMILSFYANEHDGAFPTGAGARSSDEVLAALVPRYTSDRSFFACPATGHSGDSQPDFACVTGLRADSVAALLASDAQVDARPKLRGAKVFADSEGTRGGNHGKAGGNLLFTDGHVETIGTEAPRDLSTPPGATLLNPTR